MAIPLDLHQTKKAVLPAANASMFFIRFPEQALSAQKNKAAPSF